MTPTLISSLAPEILPDRRPSVDPSSLLGTAHVLVCAASFIVGCRADTRTPRKPQITYDNRRPTKSHTGSSGRLRNLSAGMVQIENGGAMIEKMSHPQPSAMRPSLIPITIDKPPAECRRGQS
ncbi:hypothetical protein LY76DRAFT_594147 [Colletotrichum caudatum]|nr:hypothetical protein LY76DRAFT_594147 [Colletotrichum caudatum]